VASEEGVGIHHPQGDIKKISTYPEPVFSSQWSSNGLQSHWRVFWTATANGHGVTEAGSSGSPLLNQHGLIVGTLTGGESSCGNTGGADFYGKFSYHWKSNGQDAASQLEPWLDPDHEGVQVLGGTYYSNIVVASLKADTTAIPVKSRLDFVDLSSGKPEQWQWYFEGGTPSASTLQNPEGIEYPSYGTWDVSLISTGEVNSDTLLIEDYIKVEPVISWDQNEPSTFRLFFGDADNIPETMEIYTVLGNSIPFRIAETTSSTVSVNLQGHPSGVYVVKMYSDRYSFTGKLLFIK
ncbi:MAG: T9SS type A sorting domain-containing protein, partial [Bacteroidales bacterium]|nr:T9SS type A sorting domain-containing protein [Bacteroidales bacterium]